MTPDMLQKLMSDPELLAAMQQPKIMAAFADIQQDPNNLMKYMSDPEVMGLVMKLQGLVMPGM
jgi:suppressor of tumorigenicity protein 13